ncbi:MAG: CAP domain-containing protein [Clostridia bacterium]
MKKILCAVLTVSAIMLMAINSFAATNVTTILKDTVVAGDVDINTVVLDGSGGQISINNALQNVAIGGDLSVNTVGFGFSGGVDAVINNILNGVAVGGNIDISNQLAALGAGSPREPAKTPAVPDNSSQFSETEKEVLTLINKERTDRGLNELTLDIRLTKAARYKSRDMADTGGFSHRGSYGTLADLLDKFKVDYNCAGENIAYGYENAAAVVEEWMNSRGHRANILCEDFQKLGVGFIEASDGTVYWTTEFTG